MLRGVFSHLSLFAVLLHLHWGCYVHLAACEPTAFAPVCSHEHEHSPARLPDAPTHDDCHESHADAVLSAPLVAPSPEGAPFSQALEATGLAARFAGTISSALFGHADALGPLPLRASPRSPVLLN
jgi:hypothetical protein